MKLLMLCFAVLALSSYGADFPNKAVIDNPGKRNAVQVFKNGKEWKPVLLDKLLIQPGSALDLGEWNHVPAGKFGPLVIGKNGRFAFRDAPEKTVRFLGFNILSRDEYLFRYGKMENYKEIIRREAAAARRQGYNLYRINALPDAFKEKGLSGIQRISPEGFDRVDFLLSELKKNGIYIQIALLGPTYFEPSSMRKKTGDARNMHKLMFYAGREYEREQFRFAASLLNHVNPYTGLAWKDDPAIVLIEYYNELYAGLALIDSVRKSYPQDFQYFHSVYGNFLKGKYGPERHVTEADLLKTSPDFAAFSEHLVRECNLWCESQLRKAGYRGLTAQNNYRNLLYSAATWETQEVLDNHTYYKHPGLCMTPNSRVAPESSIGEAGNYVRELMNGRFENRPFCVGEFNHCFWNPYQYEAGALIGAYAALQDFSTLCIHAEVIVDANPWKWSLTNFAVGHNPIIRAGEFISAHLFRQGMVKSSPNLALVQYPAEMLKDKRYLLDAPSSEQSLVGLLCRYGISFPGPAGKRPAPKTVIRLSPGKTSGIRDDDWFTEVLNSPDSRFSLRQTVAEMRRLKIFSRSNITDVQKGIFQSDTDEITMIPSAKQLKILTPSAEVYAAPAEKMTALRSVTELSRSTDSCFALLSRDGRPLKESRKMVIVFSTRAANSGMELSADSRLLKRGTLPVLLGTGTFSCRIHRKAGYRCYALDLRGHRTAKIPVADSGTDALLHIDTAVRGSEPSVFFELVKE